ncbi:nuclear hormone receptor family member nhr-111-like isoform X2 [Centruroides sculpturatus]|uniref:nuclear hormone receptor family member nhr-111-like isoform X2 n=1 Tax=Centruroides sculpturatus TaxID=218467 RepID=UPI000C6D1CE5|nr:nuclear hormone receptor family member nhr-111-like isoform X2 [Centruroides sculpturatus]
MAAAALTETPKYCEICGDPEVSNFYGAFTCISCTDFFKENILLRREVIPCSFGSGKCSLNKRYGVPCKFCRLSKCYDVKMDYAKVFSQLPSDYKRETCTEEKYYLLFCDQQDSFLDCLMYMEQYFYKWLNSLPSFRNLSEERKKSLRLRSYAKGTILQLIERSLNVYEMLRLHNSFICCMTDVDMIFLNLIRLISDSRSNYFKIAKRLEASGMTHMEAFSALKLQLALPQAYLTILRTFPKINIHTMKFAFCLMID